LFLIGTGNLLMNSGIDQGRLPRGNFTPFLNGVQEMENPISFLGPNARYVLI